MFLAFTTSLGDDNCGEKSIVAAKSGGGAKEHGVRCQKLIN